MDNGLITQQDKFRALTSMSSVNCVSRKASGDCDALMRCYLSIWVSAGCVSVLSMWQSSRFCICFRRTYFNTQLLRKPGWRRCIINEKPTQAVCFLISTIWINSSYQKMTEIWAILIEKLNQNEKGDHSSHCRVGQIRLWGGGRQISKTRTHNLKE